MGLGLAFGWVCVCVSLSLLAARLCVPLLLCLFCNKKKQQKNTEHRNFKLLDAHGFCLLLGLMHVKKMRLHKAYPSACLYRASWCSLPTMMNNTVCCYCQWPPAIRRSNLPRLRAPITALAGFCITVCILPAIFNTACPPEQDTRVRNSLLHSECEFLVRCVHATATSAVCYVTIVIHTAPRNHRNASQNPSILLKVRVVTWTV